MTDDGYHAPRTTRDGSAVGRHAAPGTTRDTIEETLNIDGILFRLIDTAGIRMHTTDTIEQIGVGKSLEKMEQADIVLYLFDVADEVGEVTTRRTELVESGNGQRFLWIGNKVDKMGEDGEDTAKRKFEALPDAIFISARQQQHIDVLKQRLVDQVLQGRADVGDGTIVTNARHYHALQQVAASLATIHKGLDDGLPGDLLALDIRHCLHYLGEITGEITSEDRLDYIFSKFCIGK